MTLNYKTANLQTKRDIIDAVIDCLHCAFKHGGYVKGTFVRYAIVPMFKENTSLSTMSKGNEDKIDINGISLWFPDNSSLNAFVIEMGFNLEMEAIGECYLVKLGTKVAAVYYGTKETSFKPYLRYDINCLGYSMKNDQHHWKVLVDDYPVDHTILLDQIKSKEVKLTPEYILHLNNSNVGINIILELNNFFIARGWTVHVGNTYCDSQITEGTFIEAISKSAKQIIADKLIKVQEDFNKASKVEKIKTLDLFMNVGSIVSSFGYFKSRSIPSATSHKLKLYFDDVENMNKFFEAAKENIDQYGILSNKLGYVSCKLNDPNKYKFDVDEVHSYVHHGLITYTPGNDSLLMNRLNIKKATILPNYQKRLLTDDKEVEKLNRKFNNWNIKIDGIYYELPLSMTKLRRLLNGESDNFSKKVDLSSLDALILGLSTLRGQLEKLNM